MKSEKKEGVTYYPKWDLVFTICRDPVQATLSYLLPTFILGVYIYASTRLNEMQDVLASVSIATLGMITIYQQIRSSIPPIPKITFAEKILLVNLMYSLLPIICMLIWEKEYFSHLTNFLIFFSIIGSCIIYVLIKFCLQR